MILRGNITGYYFKNRGIAAIETMVVVVILLAVFTITVPLFLQKNPVNKNNITHKKLLTIKQAIVGDADKMVNKKRASFGFVGDLGVIPGSLNELTVNVAARPAYARDPLTGLYYGWRGRYVEPNDLLDAWGTAITYDTSPGIHPTSGRPYSARVSSSNLDASLTIYIYDDEISNTTNGGIVNRIRPQAPIASENGTIEISYPNGSAVLAKITTSVVNGSYATTEKIPVGYRHFKYINDNLEQLATLNGNGSSIVNFVKASAPPSLLFEHEFGDYNNLTFVGGGGWKVVTGPGDYIYINGNQGEDKKIITFGDPTWTNYRVEVEVSITPSSKPDGFGIDYRVPSWIGSDPSKGYRFKYYADKNPDFLVARFPNDFSPAQNFNASPSYDKFGLLRFYISVTTGGGFVTHVIRIEKEEAGVFVEKVNQTILEPETPDSSLAGKIGFQVFGHNGNVRMYWTKVYPL